MTREGSPDDRLAPRERRIARAHPERRFGGFTDMDGAVIFYARVRELLPPDGVALDVGCGRGTMHEDPVRVRRDLRTLRGHCRHVIGIDVDEAAAGNEHIDEYRPIGADMRWPVEDASVDLALADFVVEHVPDPPAFFAELARVVRPGGHICIRTVNRRSYLGLASRMVPNRLHARVLSGAHGERPDEDVFPTVYRCNTPRVLGRALREAGFDAVAYGSEAEPTYLSFNGLAYRAGLLHRRLAPPGVRPGLLAFGRRIGDL